MELGRRKRQPSWLSSGAEHYKRGHGRALTLGLSPLHSMWSSQTGFLWPECARQVQVGLSFQHRIRQPLCDKLGANTGKKMYACMYACIVRSSVSVRVFVNFTEHEERLVPLRRLAIGIAIT